MSWDVTSHLSTPTVRPISPEKSRVANPTANQVSSDALSPRFLHATRQDLDVPRNKSEQQNLRTSANLSIQKPLFFFFSFVDFDPISLHLFSPQPLQCRLVLHANHLIYWDVAICWVECFILIFFSLWLMCILWSWMIDVLSVKVDMYVWAYRQHLSLFDEEVYSTHYIYACQNFWPYLKYISYES